MYLYLFLSVYSDATMSYTELVKEQVSCRCRLQCDCILRVCPASAIWGVLVLFIKNLRRRIINIRTIIVSTSRTWSLNISPLLSSLPFQQHHLDRTFMRRTFALPTLSLSVAWDVVTVSLRATVHVMGFVMPTTNQVAATASEYGTECVVSHLQAFILSSTYKTLLLYTLTSAQSFQRMYQARRRSKRLGV